ncbi:MAG: bacillithiol biosynthesis deacetylase BshB1 [Cytophagales bacterium]|nr:MAG: bacillithiol biosynthesis deacetylase BshB1 [Cytophagales bacterium]TAF60375.1 MAG: bacillithiol biosynthesis deacetylase BshB1 [Cytophagales bacterium]
MNKLDILALAAHPDDVELSCSGTLMAHIAMGYRVGILDLTQGEMGSRGTVQTRKAEAEEASRIMGLHERQNLAFSDVFFEESNDNVLEIVRWIRYYQPKILLANAPKDRHPDHGKAARLAEKAFFWSGLSKIETHFNNVPQLPWRPQALYHYIQSQYLEPDFVVDISEFWHRKMMAVKAFKTQFYDPDNTQEPATFISTPQFLDFLFARAKEFGQAIRTDFGEGFIKNRQLGIKDLNNLI